ncbi:hypothetical protein DVH09_16125 [Hafnia paralvei]|nr:hypothetical protein DVH09_16125 [Hafnia paralvei]
MWINPFYTSKRCFIVIIVTLSRIGHTNAVLTHRIQKFSHVWLILKGEVFPFLRLKMNIEKIKPKSSQIYHAAPASLLRLVLLSKW